MNKKRGITPSFKPFADESTCLQINGLTIENRVDRVSLYGFLDITMDQIGLDQVRQMKILIDSVAAELEAKETTRALPEEIQIEKPVSRPNPFD